MKATLPAPPGAREAAARARTAAFASEYPFEPRFLELPVGALHYLDEGPRGGETLLCLHGNPSWSFLYRRLVLALRPERRVLALDHLGCGLSDKPQAWSYRLADHIENLVRFIEALDLRQITLVVHDWGGAIGLGAAARIPDRVARLVLTNTAAFPEGRVPPSIRLARLPGLGQLLLRGANAFARAALSMAVEHPERLTPEVRRGFLAPYPDWKSRIGQWRFVRDIPTSPEHPSHATLSAIARELPGFSGLPIAIAWGERDFCFTPRFRERWQELFPRARVLAVEDAGHYLLEDAHERILPWLKDFLDSHPIR